MRPQISPKSIEQILPPGRSGAEHFKNSAGDLESDVCGDDFDMCDVGCDFTTVLGGDACAVDLGSGAVAVGVAVGVTVLARVYLLLRLRTNDGRADEAGVGVELGDLCACAVGEGVGGFQVGCVGAVAFEDVPVDSSATAFRRGI
jgi:hypothetical protein